LFGFLVFQLDIGKGDLIYFDIEVDYFKACKSNRVDLSTRLVACFFLINN